MTQSTQQVVHRHSCEHALRAVEDHYSKNSSTYTHLKGLHVHVRPRTREDQQQEHVAHEGLCLQRVAGLFGLSSIAESRLAACQMVIGVKILCVPLGPAAGSPVQTSGPH